MPEDQGHGDLNLGGCRIAQVKEGITGGTDVNLRGRVLIGTLAAMLAGIAPNPACADEQPTKVKGYVLDSACAFTKNLNKPISVQCAIDCAKGGSPLVLLTEDGHIYWPISDKTPATGLNSRLLKFAGKKVIVTGKIYERDGSHAIVIETIEAEGAGK
jgi:hypothetical protein